MKTPRDVTPAEISKTFEISREISRWVSRYVIPLYHQTGVKPEPIGSAFLVRIAKRFFLVTAAHVLDLNTENQRLFYFVGRKRRRYLEGNQITTPLVNGTRSKDQVDVGVVALAPGDNLPDPNIEKLAVELNQFQSDPVGPSEYAFVICGFPITKNRANTATKEINPIAYTWLGKGASDDAYVRTDLSPITNLLVKFPKKDVWRDDGKGPLEFPAPQGISGSPVWRLFKVKDGWAVPSGEPRIVGVAIEHRSKDKVIVGTNIGTAIKMIDELMTNSEAGYKKSRVDQNGCDT